MHRTTLVVPCYNEADRLGVQHLDALLAEPGIRLVLVDDGSTDATFQVLRAFCGRAPERTFALQLPRNQGKAEAVRLGMLDALARGADAIGYVDADFATPASEVLRLVHTLTTEPPDRRALLASRVLLLGTHIARKPARHYLGRIFATVASLALRLPVYDTQCGTKLFRADDPLRRALGAPFRSRWIFDVELIARLREAYEEDGLPPDRAFLEVPLKQWIDKPGSKFSPLHMLRGGFELLLFFARQRAAPRRPPDASRDQ